MRERRRVVRQQLLHVLLQPREQLVVTDEPVLDDFRQTRAQLARRQRLQRVRVRDHGARLMKRADQILAAGMIHPGLAADRRVHLRQQAWWAPARTRRRADKQAAANPAMSPTTPPPKATTVQSRAKRFATSTSSTRATVASVLCDFAVRQSDFDDPPLPQPCFQRR